MPDINIGQQGKLKSIPKIVRINGDGNKKAIYRNSGQNHTYPFFWATTATMPLNETTMVLASGIKWHGYDLASYATIVATPTWAANCYITTNSGTNVVTLNVSSAATSSGSDKVNLMFMLGSDIEIEGMYNSYNIGTMPSFP
jgi:hypothetical protein